MAHRSWPICSRCEGKGHEPGDSADARRTVCTACKGVGRTQPKGWREPVIEVCKECKGVGHFVKDEGSAARAEREEAERRRLAPAGTAVE